METLGSFIRKSREAKDISLREFARRIGISAAFVSDIELGRRFPSEDMLLKIAEELNQNAEELRKLDTRAPVEEIKRMAEADPTFGLAFRTLVDRNIKAEDLLAWARHHSKQKKS
jgi:transcriptional regulator with XRE-family HTH domain